MKNFVKFIIAVFLIPFVFFSLLSAGRAAADVFGASEIMRVFLCGALLYALIHFLIYNFSRPYVLAHECTHALAALFFGYKVHEMKVRENSGHVKLSDHNTAVVLAPYVIPVYFLLWACTCYFVDMDWRLEAGLLGFLWAHHIVHTVTAISETTQPDLKAAGGVIFSLVVIIGLNIAFALFCLALLFPGSVALWAACKDAFFKTLNFWQKVLNYIVDLLKL